MTLTATVEAPTAFDRLSKRNFERLARYIYAYSGIKMPSSKTTMLEGRLRRRLRVTGHDSLDAYCAYLFEEDAIDVEAVHLIDAVTTNKTDFFREPNHFTYMAETLLPEIAARGQRSLRIWSSACSTGAEPYTIAMVTEDFARANGIDYRILATDLSTEVLATAVRGIYPADVVAPVPAPLRKKYVRYATKQEAGSARIHPVLRSRVGFARMNLMSDRYPVGDAMDIIFCRNVLIYFDKATQQAVLKRLCDCLTPGGILFIGHSESITGLNLPVTQLAGTILRRE